VTATADGYQPAKGFELDVPVSISAEIPLESLPPMPHELRTIPIPGRTLPIDLVRRSGPARRAVRAAVTIARELYERSASE
jgi:hypothetical protein